jgi:hypothetical protein
MLQETGIDMDVRHLQPHALVYLSHVSGHVPCTCYGLVDAKTRTQGCSQWPAFPFLTAQIRPTLALERTHIHCAEEWTPNVPLFPERNNNTAATYQVF